MDTTPIKNLESILNYIEKQGYQISKLVVVTKNHPSKVIQLLYDYGHRDFGENKYQEARDKFPLIETKKDSPLIGHHIGPLQSGNARNIPKIFEWVHGVGSWNALEILAKAALKKYQEEKKKTFYLIQLNLTREESKLGGMFIEEFEQTVQKQPEKIIQNEGLIWKGFMVMGPSDGNLEVTRKVFKELRTIRDKYMQNGELSMGMSHDWKIALEEGATILRIGTAITGSRNINI
ncbi:MAG: YggS family pyridoxal phosphate-dependent enzyme [Leptospiraceae bacterium]|nr:YggS family pyridoxal phosphate-dependent enzyme [Leptospiraceae bacterium]MDW7975669.1 YggS family pyridoxal phosphate-dependent enzyme [Leptospiraceae bacterium]